MRCEYCSHRRSCNRIISVGSFCDNYRLSVTYLRKFQNLNIGDKIWILTDNRCGEKLYNITIFEVDLNFKNTGNIVYIPNHTLNNVITKKLYCRSAFLTLEEAKKEIIDRGYTLDQVCEVATVDPLELEYTNITRSDVATNPVRFYVEDAGAFPVRREDIETVAVTASDGN